MLYVIRFFPEITIKTRPVRQRLIKGLRRNLRVILHRLDAGISVTGDWDILEVDSGDGGEALDAQVLEVLLRTPGIGVVMPVVKRPLPAMEDIAAEVLPYYRDALAGRTFAVRCKRQGAHGFTSSDVERHVGAVLLRETEAAGVDLTSPQVTVRAEIRHKDLYIVKEHLKGLGGYPLGTQEGVLSLISGGFDSAVASYLCMRRGLRTHFLFFNLGGKEHELAVKEVALYLWMKFGSSHRVKFVSVPFERVVEEILEKVDNSQMGVVLKRMMLRAADQIATELNVDALVTGESVAQVASQTMPNLSVIDQVSERLVLRPLIVTDKQDIIDIAREIGTESFSAVIPEYCGVISVKPTTNAKRARIEAEEARMDMRWLDAAVADKEIQMIDRVVEVVAHRDVEPETYSAVPTNAVVVDIRHPDEQQRRTLVVPGAEILSLPFYQLSSRFAALDAARQYVLYCEHGMMSRLHASHLKDVGHNNVGVYRPGP